MRIYNIRTAAACVIGATAISVAVMLNGCAESQKVAAKSGAQLWAENCQRCHNTPSPSTFSHEQWVTIGMHMQTRAQLTEQEKEKIVAFLSQ
ncbi:c-type cytochrome [Puia dinghuensis]|uniref:Cytochrome c domain-containing protein n=1 Tax=Puia dinghuensis TaxID=1792502 RepID=A0A8J2UC10_9BACT|nr:cytochrome c [Puia dinghuensis]GGA94526.1 hypothetical protein GCM10011511_17270 [Puia dinghuensis]